jgi:type I site-specific restriction-modification system R (restriction) subunit
LNKRLAAKNKWREYATKALREASKQYQKEVIEPLKDSPNEEDQKRYKKIIENMHKREARKNLLPLALRSEEAKKLLDELNKLSDVELLEHYYAGLKPKKKKKSKLAELAKK